ncbi:MAG TPA: hypothetical protein VNV66_07495 [Pilimelia sp.]|nr:hypothetical protein [Pilimelia sp.]
MRATLVRWTGGLALVAGVVLAAPAPARAAPAAAIQLAGTGTATGGAVGQQAAAAPRAMWLWSRADPAAVIHFAVARGVAEIYAAVPWNVGASGDLPRLQDLKQRADAAGIRLSALGGDPEWAVNHWAARTWQRSAMETGLFAATHVDVEPYVLDRWNTDRAGTVSAFLGMLDAMRANDPRPLEADVPFWYGGIAAGGRTLADEVLDRVDAVTVMSYRDTATGPNSMADVAADMLVRGTASGTPVRLGAETHPLPDCPYCTFAEEGQAAMLSTLAAVDAAVSGYQAYAGIAVHHYDSWRVLGP